MQHQLHDLSLRGCSPVPLAHYLKALGILRIVSEQVAPQTQGWWENEVFHLRSPLGRDELVQFFLNDYEPTPLVAPWNGGSGFYPKDNQAALAAIRDGAAQRFAPYRELIALCSELLAAMSLTEKPKDDDKPRLLQICRNRFPDSALPWLDAAVVLTADGPKYPPLLGTGGNDGRLEFTNNYMQRLTEIFDPSTGDSKAGMNSAIREALFAAPSTERANSPIGQFDPGSAGGANAGVGYDAASRINLWDFVLMLEGSILFAAASVKKLESIDPGTLAYPFCVRPAGVGYGSAHISDEATSRAEMWMPLWQAPSSCATITAILSEGRVEANRRRAKNSVDFARAIASLGIDRGIDAFQRYGFQQRNGLSYFAVPLERFNVHSVPSVDELLSPIDQWLQRFRRAATSKTASARASRALRRLESAIIELCQRGRAIDVQAVFIALGQAEQTVAHSKKLREDVRTPLALSHDWLRHAYLGFDDVEFRLAASLASIQHESVGPLRRHLEPIDPKSWKSNYPKWAEADDDPSLVWNGANLVNDLVAVLQRRLMEITRLGKEQSDADLLLPLKGKCWASPGDLVAFIENNVSDERIEALIRALSLINWSTVKGSHVRDLRGPRRPFPDAAYALLKLCHLPQKLGNHAIKLAPQIAHRAAVGDGTEATRLAARRLRASGFPPAIDVIACRGARARRTAAALMFPISPETISRLQTAVTRLDAKEADGDSSEGSDREFPLVASE